MSNLDDLKDQFAKSREIEKSRFEKMKLGYSADIANIGASMAKLSQSVAALYQVDRFNTQMLSNALEPIMTAYAKMTPTYFSNISPMIKSMQNSISQIINVNPVNNLGIDSFAKALQANQIQMQNIFSSIATSQLSFMQEAVRTFDFERLNLNENGTLSYGETVYGEEELATELTSQIAEISKSSQTFKGKIEYIKEKFWLAIFIMWIVMFIPQFAETSEFYNNLVIQAKEMFFTHAHSGIIIKEKAKMREEPNSKSEILCVLLYDYKVEIIEVIPRWYKIKYIDEHDNEYIGWVSKINIELEDK